nr:Gag-Pol polyprotein [Tanacetum cinerariifolium]
MPTIHEFLSFVRICICAIESQKRSLEPSCEQGKSKRASHPPKPVLNSRQRLHLLHMDLCGPMRIASINGKRYVLVIVLDDGDDVTIDATPLYSKSPTMVDYKIYKEARKSFFQIIRANELKNMNACSLCGSFDHNKRMRPKRLQGIYSKGLLLLVKDLLLLKIRIKQYFLMTDYSLWEVIHNVDSPIPTRVIDGVVQPVVLTIAEQRLARKNELKAR